MKKALKATTEADRRVWSAAIMNWLTKTESWAEPRGAVAIFGGMRFEPELLGMLPWLVERGFEVALFGIDEESMTPYRVQGTQDLVVGSWGALEPRQCLENRLSVEDLGTVLVPGLAFSRKDGMRLGRGKGHFDRILGHPGFRGQPVGVAFTMQLLDVVPGEAHDCRMSRLLTESGWLDPER